MKKLLLTALLAFGLLFATQTSLQAQTKIGAGLVYGEAAESAGINLNATFRVSPQIEFAPKLNIYFPEEDDTGLDGFWTANIDGHYIFAAETEYHLYGLGGLNIASAEIAGIDESESELGINLGVGGEYHLEQFSLFSELKYVIGDFDQVVLGVGARFPLN